jgi:hypothetical protein
VNLATSWGRRALLALAVPALLAGCISEHRGRGHHGFSDDRSQVQVVTTNIGGKNVYIPSTIVLTAGAGRTLSLFNTTDQPHGFAIPALGIEMVLVPGQEHVIELPTLEGGRIHVINCHIHPPHRSATLVVVPSR